jgi:DNA-binding NarL/FixJ family response regulator
MSDIFYQATRVVIDGRLSRIFTGPRAKGASTRLRLDQDEEVVDTIVIDSRKGHSPQQIASKLGISPSSVTKVKNIFRERWEGFEE